jgi:Carboxypeptidase regulatory-like domain
VTSRLLACTLLIVLAGCSSDAPATSTTPVSPTPAPTNIYTLSGTIRDPKGAPLGNAFVYVGADPRQAGFGTATTDPNGRYVATGLYAGTQLVSVSKPGFMRVAEMVEIAPGAVRDFTMKPGVIVSGRTVEAGVGPLNGVTITVTSGPDAGVQTTTALFGGFSLPPLLPGDFTIRASKDGYDSVDRTVHATADLYLDDVTLKWAYGACLMSVAPVLVDRVPAAGATESVAVQAQGGRAWTAKPDVPWMNLVSNASASGSATLQFQVQPNPIGALQVRSGAIQIRCSETEGQNIWITQMVDCRTTVEPDAQTPRVFAANGGPGRLLVRFGVPGCQSRDYSEVDWMFLAGVSSYISGEVNFAVRPNMTGAGRTGAIVVGETRWIVKQDFQPGNPLR